MSAAAHPERILIVEDEVLVNLDVAEALRDDGFEPLTALSAEDGLAILEREPGVRVVFTDVDLPGRDGIALIREIARRWPQIEILVTSGKADPGLATLDLVTTWGRFVEKPYPAAAVVRRVHEILGTSPHH